MKRRVYTVEEQIQRAWDMQQIRNIMGRHAYYHEYNHHEWEMDELFVNKEEHKASTAFGQCHGFQIGYDLVDENYSAKSFNTWRKALKNFIDEDPSIEDSPVNYAIGSDLIHLITTPLIEIAEDGLTAQANFDGNGQITMAYPKSDHIDTKIMFERYSCDLVKEDGEWKFWKMFIVTDVFIQPAGKDVRDEEVDINKEMEFFLVKPEEGEIVDESTKIILNYPMMAYTEIFGCPEWPPFPEPYSTYSATVPNDVFSHPTYRKEANK